jgi:hypothetical protein
MASPVLNQEQDVRILPKGDFPRKRLSSLANRENWLLARVIAGDSSTPSEWIATTSDRSTFVHWISDPKIDITYILVTGAQRDALARVVNDAFECYSLHETIADARAAEERVARTRAIYHLAILAPYEEEEGIVEIFRSYAVSADPEVRGATVLAMSYVGWPSFRGILTPLSESDADPEVREDAAILLRNMKAYPARSTVPT